MLTFRALALRQSDWRNCGLYVGLYVQSGATPLVGIWWQENRNKLVEWKALVDSVGINNHKTSVVEWSLQNMYQGQNFILTSPSPLCMFCFCFGFCFGFCHNLFIHLFVCLLGKSMKCLVIQKNSYHKNLWDNGKFKGFFQGGGDNNSTINSNRYPLPSPLPP